MGSFGKDGSIVWPSIWKRRTSEPARKERTSAMCPVCLANAALIAAGATSSGGLTALAMNKFCRKKKTNQTRGKQNERNKDETQSGSGRNESANRVTAGVGCCAPATTREGERVDPPPCSAGRRASA